MQSITVISSFCHHYSRFSPVFNPRAFRKALTKSKKAVSGKDPLTAADDCVSAFLDLVGLGSRCLGLNVGEMGQYRFLRNALDLAVYIIFRDLHDHGAQNHHADQVG